MPKYQRLTDHLATMEQPEWIASFAEIEDLLGFPLPQIAHSHRSWWANVRQSQGWSWTSAGWETSNVDLANERVTFVISSVEIHKDRPPRGLTIAEAKAGVAARMGVLPSQVQIQISG